MSTRCTITVSESDIREFHIFRHSDGYPEGKHGVIKGIQKALKYAWELPRFDAGDFAGALVRAMKEGPGNIYLTANSVYHREDVEYHYAIYKTGDDLTIVVFRNDETKFSGTLDNAVLKYAEEGLAE